MTHLLDQAQIAAILSTYGYWAIFVIVAMESAGLPLPGETMLVGAAIYARLSGAMSIETIVFAAAAGAIVGDNVGYWIGRNFGVKMLERHGRRIGLGPEKLRLGQYLFYKWGGAIVFFGRFISILRILAALLAGANRVPPGRFMFYNATGGVVWAAVFGFGAFSLTASFQKVEGSITTTAGIALLVGLFLLWRYYKQHEQRLMRQADDVMSQRAEP
ncbi:DedA family protein [Methylocystis sp. WRRC1]|uniref:DedA family protein n=1 Tax=unclassified Methylocystis TaxID=2625913 RepID=UPI0001F87C07|nr:MULTISPECIES: DedA family protein [unclassified Methylocystis]MCC3246941.1 DedA family protein [Methylocystis sp. WRRC1]